jgi:hypothetical protein
MVSKVNHSKSYLEILDYLNLVFPQESLKIRNEQLLDTFAAKWNNIYTQEYKKLMDSEEESSYYTDAEGKKFTCENMAMLTVFNAISDEFGG